MTKENKVISLKELSSIIIFISSLFGAYFAIDARVDAKIKKSENMTREIMDSRLNGVQSGLMDVKEGIKRLENIMLEKK